MFIKTTIEIEADGSEPELKRLVSDLQASGYKFASQSFEMSCYPDAFRPVKLTFEKCESM